MSIKPLPGDVVAQIKSSVVITSLNNVICGLIKNALDAGATKINVSVDYSRGYCSVEDNGNGIQPSEFADDGGLGQLHYTSKFPPQPNVHGTNGVFLASVGSLSLLSITSHHRDFHSHNSMTIHNSKILKRHTPCPSEHRIQTFSHGTRATVRDLFGSMPVRVKHRALQAEKSSFTKEWDRLVLDFVALLIAWPDTVSVAVRETTSRQKVTLKTNAQCRKRVENGCQLLYQASLCDTPSSSEWVAVGATAPTLSISGFVCREPVATKSVQFLSCGIEPLSNEQRSNILYEEINKVFADSSFGVVEDDNDTNGPAEMPKLDGFLSKDLKAKKGVDRWPMFFLQITPTSGLQSHFKVDDVLDDRQPTLNLILDLLKAMLYEFLKKNHCRPKAVTLTAKPNNHSPRSQARSAASDMFARGLTTESQDQSNSRRATPESRSASPFAAWSKVKSGQVVQNIKTSDLPGGPSLHMSSTSDNDGDRHRSSTNKQSTPTNIEDSRPLLYGINGKLTRKPFENVDIHPQGLVRRSLSQSSRGKKQRPQTINGARAPRDKFMECVNPVTQMAVSVNSRTGFSAPTKTLTLNRRASAAKDSGLDRDSADSGVKSSNAQPWVKELINKWNNPVFELTEEPILKLPDITEILAQDIKLAGQSSCCGQGSLNMGTRHETSTLALTGRVSKQTLSQAEVIAQVDQKFIFVKMPLNRVKIQLEQDVDTSVPSSGLFLIDQHAADERCRVEELLAGYFKPTADSAGELYWQADLEILPKPVYFELSRQEESLLRGSRQHFAYWGIAYEMEAVSTSTPSELKRQGSGRSHNKVKLTVTRLPPAIIERCRTEPRLLAELIRKEAWRLNDESRSLQQPRARRVSDINTEEVPVWLSLLHGCPPGILDLINSRSCRSSIMFNDPLTLDQCHQLLGRLSKCAFPFQCAHGRPSMVPVADLRPSPSALGHLTSHDLQGKDRDGTFGQAFRRWKEMKR